MNDVQDIKSGAGHVRITGLRRTLRQLGEAGADAEDMKDLMFHIGMIVVNASTAPDKSGTLASTVRAGRGKTKAVVRAGGAKAKYAGVIHYGWPAHNIAPQPFLTDALAKKRRAVFDALDRGMSDLLRKNQLK